VFAWARDAHPEQPLTSGVSTTQTSQLEFPKAPTGVKLQGFQPFSVRKSPSRT
jgi:hypothetical protein